MKSIQEFVSGRVHSLSELKSALRLAMQLEFSTIPPYLCAQWSIKSDPDRTEGVVHRVVSDEMNHFALAGNLLTAIGGRPHIARSSFVPKYPLKSLPGGILQKLPVDLRPLDRPQLEVFMQIEYPQFPPVAWKARPPGPATIGDFYDSIIEGLEAVKPHFDRNACRIPVFGASPIDGLATAIEAVERIKSEGEGLQDSPEQPTSHDTVLAHYYAFKEIHEQKRLIVKNGKWVFGGDPIAMPEVWDFSTTACSATHGRKFITTFSALLSDLEACWTRGAQFDLTGMFRLRIAGLELIRAGLRPPFCWTDAEMANPS
ncbi:ferritin-like domain-containing protein [Bradyrhizobium sp. 1.29L]